MNEKIKKAGVIGYPIAHSKSPLIHDYWIKQHGLNASYEAIDIPPPNLEERVHDLVDQGYRGFNVTIPHKQAIMMLCDDVDTLAEKVGAVNTVIVKEDGSLFGTNTDVFGFVENLRSAAQGFGYGWTIAGGPALVLGAGGAARAAVQGLINEGVPEIFVANRTFDKAKDLESMSPLVVKAVEWDKRDIVAGRVNFIVNTTSLGMTGQEPLEIDLSGCHEDAVVHDIVYAPLYTDLLKQARAHDLRIVTGIGMLLHQARPAFHAWFGVMPDVTETLEDLVL